MSNSISDNPDISVLLPVYNGDKHLEESISSILQQTLKNFELIIIDDGSSDKSADIIRSFKDERIRFIQQHNIGLGATLNRMIGLSRGRYLARQDQDDISMPNRLLTQFNKLESDNSIILLGSHAQIIDQNGNSLNQSHKHPSDDINLKYLLLFDNPFVHSSVVIRRTALLRVGGYEEKMSGQFPEDFDLWQRLSHIGTLANIPEYLLYYRTSSGGMSGNFGDEKKTISTELCLRQCRPYWKNGDVSNIATFLELLHRLSKTEHVSLRASRMHYALMAVTENFVRDHDITKLQITRSVDKIRFDFLKSFVKAGNIPLIEKIKAVYYFFGKCIQ